MGKARGENQRYQCKDCKRVINEPTQREKPESMNALSVLLYTMFSASHRSIEQLMGVSTVSVYKWVKKYAESLERPEITLSCKTILIDEMWHFVNGKKTKFGFGF